MSESTPEQLAAIAAHNESVDANWNDPVLPDEIEDRGVFLAKSASHAYLPERMVRRVLANAKPEDREPDENGIHLFLPEAVDGTCNYVMKITPKSRAFFDMTRKEKANAIDRIAVSEKKLNRVTPVSALYASMARIYSTFWPALLHVWTDGKSIYIRKAFTEEVWHSITDKHVIRAMNDHSELFDIPTPTKQ